MGWICTDPDTFQWQRRVGERSYEMVDTACVRLPSGEDVYRFAHGIVDLDDYEDEIERILSSYGYEERKPDPILAEMAFEDDWLEYMHDERFFGVGVCSEIAMRYLMEG